MLSVTAPILFGRCVPHPIHGGIINAVLLARNALQVCQHALQVSPAQQSEDNATLRAKTQNQLKNARMPTRSGTCVLAAIPGGIPSAVPPVLAAQAVALPANRRQPAVPM